MEKYAACEQLVAFRPILLRSETTAPLTGRVLEATILIYESFGTAFIKPYIHGILQTFLGRTTIWV